jgi:hypothetical protein
MSEMDQVEISPSTPHGVPAYRRRIRVGFALFAAALGTALVYLVASRVVMLIASPPGAELDDQSAWNLWSMVVDGITSALLLAGVVTLHRVPLGERSRWATTILLAMCGADIAFMGLRAAGTDSKVVALCEILGLALGWVELWMIAVIAAEAAESADRLDLIHQTEVVGNLVIWGGFTWLLFTIWSFDIDRLNDSPARVAPDGLTTYLGFGSTVLLLIAMARTAMYCMGLVSTYAPVSNEPSPS